MLEYVHMKNFQKHEDKRITLSDNVTYITGKNNDGKSCVFRAILWVSMNEGSSKQYRRTYLEDGVIKTSSETSVEIGVDGHVIKRVLSSSKNEYYVDGVKLTGFGRGVPAPVASIFSMSSLNVSPQFSPLFLVGDTDGAIAEELAKVASLEEMDMLTAKIASDIRTKSNELSDAEDVYKDCCTKEESLIPYTDLFTTITDLNTFYKKYVEKSSTELQSIQELLCAISSYKDITPIVKLLDSTDAYKESDFILEDLTEIEDVLHNLIKTVDVDIESLTELTDDSFNEENLNEVIKTITELERISIDETLTQAELDSVLSELSDYDVCPLCGKEIDHA